MSEPDVGPAFMGHVVRVQEESEFRFSRQPTTFRFGECREVVVRCEHGPVLGDLHRYEAIHRAYL